MIKLESFMHLLEKAIRLHTAALIYPVNNSEEREINTKWIVNHYTNHFLEEETKLRDIYCLGLYHGQIPRFLELNSKEYRLFTSIRAKVISNYALGVSECALFEYSPQEDSQSDCLQKRMRNFVPAKNEIIIISKQTRNMQVNDHNFIQHIISPLEKSGFN